VAGVPVDRAVRRLHPPAAGSFRWPHEEEARESAMITRAKTRAKTRAMAGALVLAVSGATAIHGAGPVTVTKVTTPARALQFEVTVPGSLDAVWAAFTTADGLASWLWRDVRVDARPGGDWLAIFPQSTGGGTIVSLTPRRQIVISALAPDRFPAVRETRTQATFEFSPMSLSS